MNTKKIEAIYPLSPSQQGILFETLASPGSGIHIEQTVLSLQGNFNLIAWEKAWKIIIERHSILRTGFVWKNQDQPAQFVLQTVKIPLETEDWREFSPSHQKEKLTDYIQTKRQQGFNLTQVPIMSLALFQVGDDTYQFVWTFHHILLDGWSLGIIMQEVQQCYEELSQGQNLSLKPTHPYRKYITWLQQQNLAAAQTFWQDRLKGFTNPTALGKTVSVDNCAVLEQSYGRQTAYLSASTMAKLQSLVKQNRLTLSIVLQGVWALLLSCYSGELDVIFGASVSGRPSEISGIGSMAGMFINTVPIRCKIDPDASIWKWLQEIQQEQLPQKSYEYCSQGQIHNWSELSSSLPMYESILVVENYPINTSAEQVPSLKMNLNQSFALGAQTNYPLTILAMPSSELELVMVYRTHRFDNTSIIQILEHFLNVLEKIAQKPESNLFSLKSIIPETQIPEVKPQPKLDGEQLTEGFVLPRDPVERKLAQIWSEILDLKLVGLQDNFFALGGHSILAVRLMAEIEKHFGKNLPLVSLFLAPTIEQLADVLRQSTDSISWSSLVPIQPRGSRPPLFLVPGGGGNVIYFSQLAKYFSSDQPFYGLQSVGLDGESEPHTRVEDIAAHNIREIQSIQAQGPYLLGGHSFGGTVAFEMAQQLHKQGQEVALLAIIDVAAPEPIENQVNPFLDCNDNALWLTIISDFLGTLFGTDLMLGEPETYYQALTKLTPDEQFNYVYDRLQEISFFPPGKGSKQLHGYLNVMKGNALCSYFPETVAPIKISVFNCKEKSAETTKVNSLIAKILTGKDNFDESIRPKNRSAPDLGWGLFSPKTVDIYEIPGDHLSMITEPNVQILAENLMACIEKAKAKK
ncbi:condensation domain-containing protein [Okeania sp. SIO2B3]|uniref:condensation domain-containing protein n=1 Tax=Okeania sp. SIO2B3 TaxID=2607784 RepID=UPI0013C1A7A8|nr:condensation domain-containing protein [Okeania sp. SIO2B3]NET44013.1 hypothetical protein [Okeania sp. SIO2B3]